MFIIVFFIASVSSFAAQQSFKLNTSTPIGIECNNYVLNQKLTKQYVNKQPSNLLLPKVYYGVSYSFYKTIKISNHKNYIILKSIAVIK